MNLNLLLKENPKKLIKAFIIPTIIAQVIFAFSRTAEKVFLGSHLGEEALAAVTVTFPLFTIIIAFSMWIRVGAGVNISLSLGRKDKNYAEKILGNAVSLLTILSIIIIIISLIFLDEILLNIGANEALLPLSSSYMKITLIGLLINFYAFGIGYIIRSEGNPLKGMWMLVAGAIVNVFLSYIFIIKLEWGMQGASLAPVIGNLVSVSLIVYHLFMSNNRNISLKLKNLRLDKTIVIEITSIGLSAFIIMVSTSIIGMFANVLLMESGGTLYVGVMGSLVFTSMFIQIIITGLCYGFQPLFGYGYGNKDYNRLKTYLKRALFIASLFSLIIFLFLFSFSEKIAGLYSKENSNFIATTVVLMQIFFITLPLLGFNIMGSYFFQSIGDVKKAVFLNLTSKLLVLLGFYILPIFFKIKGVFLAFPLAELVLFIILVFLLKKENRIHLKAQLQ